MGAFSIRCVDAVAAEKLAADLTENDWRDVTVEGDTVSFPANSHGWAAAVAEHALESGYAHDQEAATLIGSLG